MQFARQHYGGKFFATGQNDSSAHIPYKPKDPFICLCKLAHTFPLQLRDIHQQNSSLSIFVAWTLGQNTAPGFQLQHVRQPQKGTASSLMPFQHKSVSKLKWFEGWILWFSTFISMLPDSSSLILYMALMYGSRIIQVWLIRNICTCIVSFSHSISCLKVPYISLLIQYSGV